MTFVIFVFVRVSGIVGEILFEYAPGHRHLRSLRRPHHAAWAPRAAGAGRGHAGVAARWRDRGLRVVAPRLADGDGPGARARRGLHRGDAGDGGPRRDARCRHVYVSRFVGGAPAGRRRGVDRRGCRARRTRGIACVRTGASAGPSRRARQPMGFCLFNSIAVGAAHARARGASRVAIMDYDVHHGNGTQWMFYDDPSVFFVSSHQFPFYPGTGAADGNRAWRGQGLHGESAARGRRDRRRLRSRLPRARGADAPGVQPGSAPGFGRLRRACGRSAWRGCG